MQKFNVKNWDIIYYVILAFILILAFYLRLKLFILNPEQHHDESNLALNLINGSFIDMFKPLKRLQAAPPLFLVISKLNYKLININYTAEFSDAILKIFPFICSVVAVPLFTKLLNSLFKQKFINISGTLILALNPMAIYYSCVFKQYALEMLVTIILLLTITNINFKSENFKKNNIITFILLGFAPLFSLSSYFIIAGIFIYLTYLLIKNRKIFYFQYILATLIPIILTLFIITPFYHTHSNGMYIFWQDYFRLNFIQFIKNFLDIYKIIYDIKFSSEIISIYILYIILISFINKKILFTISTPFTLLYLAVYFSLYPGRGRLLLFAYPLLIILLLFPFSIFKSLQKNIASNILCLILIILFLPHIYKLSNTNLFILKPDRAKTTLDYLSKNYDNKSPIIISGSSNSYKYYLRFYNISNNYLFINQDNWKTKLEQQPSGTYYMLSGYYKNSAKDIYEYTIANTKLIEHKQFNYKNNNFGYYIKFQK